MKTTNDKTAIISNNRNYSYQDLQAASNKIACQLLVNENDLLETRVAFMIEPGFDYVAVQWSIWKAGGVAVPLCVSYPLNSLAYVLEDTQTQIIIVSPAFEGVLKDYASEKNIRLVILGKENQEYEIDLPTIEPSRRAMILYTSGTTNLPKGVVTTHANLEAQITTLIKAWQYSQNSVISILYYCHIACFKPAILGKRGCCCIFLFPIFFKNISSFHLNFTCFSLFYFLVFFIN